MTKFYASVSVLEPTNTWVAFDSEPGKREVALDIVEGGYLLIDIRDRTVCYGPDRWVFFDAT